MSSLAYLKIQGSPFDAGNALGRFGADAVHHKLVGTKVWAEVMAWKNSPQAHAMAELVRERFPHVWSELNGLAAGLQLPADEVFLWNCRGDFWAFAPDGCTTILLPGQQPRITHNEDGFPGFAGHCAVVEYAVTGQAQIASFVYPGSTPGHTFAVTDNGLGITVNNIRQKEATAGVPRMVLSRAVLNAPDARSAVALLQEHRRAGAFHLAMVQRGSTDLLSVEYGSYACSVQCIDAPSVHANHAIHVATRDLPQIVTGSSGFRQIRGQAVLDSFRAQRQPVDPLAVLADTSDARFPIYRNDPDDSDDENTMATADMRAGPEGIVWDVRQSPMGPVLFSLQDGHARLASQ